MPGERILIIEDNVKNLKLVRDVLQFHGYSTLEAETGEAGTVEFVRRLVFNALIGNGDAHLKNWSLIYPDGRTTTVSSTRIEGARHCG